MDNPMGDEQQDILILGVHDRNRALHGDVVVVRIKDRNCWVVSYSLICYLYHFVLYCFS